MEWTHKQIDEDGGMGSARPEHVGFTVFAWGMRDTEPGDWQLWAENPDGDLDLLMCMKLGGWTEEEAKAAADKMARHIKEKHADERKRLVIAAALLLAEIERLDRATLTPTPDPR